MGVINVTPDSFSDGGVLFDRDAAVDAGVRMAEEGAAIIDVGGESTRPGAATVDGAEEHRRVIPVVEALAKRVDVPISVDTYKASTANAALAAGATIVNDISGLRYEPELANVVAKRGAAVILMHTRGRSRDMYQQASYGDVVAEVLDELRESMSFAASAGVGRTRIMVDPGLGFAKEAAHSFEALARLDEFAELGCPIVAGPSRKSFLARALGGAAPGSTAPGSTAPDSTAPAASRDWATAAAVTAAVLAGAHVVRVHAVGEMLQVVRVADEIRRYHRVDS
ncbi:MAG: dihydropteroate synthase [Acidobacteria bacterium]|nr:MAG: dihydropteroate synthase [Acidobacteriota bacterium]